MVDLEKDEVVSLKKKNKVVRKRFLIDPRTGKRIYPKNAEFFHILIDTSKSN